MTISDQIDALQKRAADLKSSFDQSRQETNEQVKARLSHAKADIAALQSAVKEETGEGRRPHAKPVEIDESRRRRENAGHAGPR